MLRYKSTGEVHKDFHGLTCATLHYLIDTYGEEAMRQVIRNTARQVYRTMHEALKNGDTAELEEYWSYYLGRECGKFEVEKLPDGVRLTVTECPALRHLVKLEQQPDHIMCEATGIFNEALTEGSPFSAELVSTGTFSCEQTIRRETAKK